MLIAMELSELCSSILQSHEYIIAVCKVRTRNPKNDCITWQGIDGFVTDQDLRGRNVLLVGTIATC